MKLPISRSVSPIWLLIPGSLGVAFAQLTTTGVQPAPNYDTFIPPVMGVIADGWGTTASFVILGIVLGLLCAPISWITRRGARMRAAEQASD